MSISSTIATARSLDDPSERDAVVSIVRTARSVFAASPFADRIVTEEYPGADVADDGQIVDCTRRHGMYVSHAAGSCAMRPNPYDVVDAELRV